MSPGLLRLMQKNMNPSLSEGGSSLKFGPEEGPDFFVPYGWKPIEVRSPLKAAARFKRLSFGMQILSLLPQSNGHQVTFAVVRQFRPPRQTMTPVAECRRRIALGKSVESIVGYPIIQVSRLRPVDTP